MGLLKRAAQRREEDAWAVVPPGPFHVLEERIAYAHVVVVFERGDQPGAVYLTNQRLFWASADGRTAEFPLSTCRGFAVRNDRPNQVGVVCLFDMNDGNPEPLPLLIYPQQPKSAANRVLAREFIQQLARELLRQNPDWSN